MNKDYIIIFMFFSILFLFYEINNLKKNNIEKFTTTPTTEDQINTAVKKIYLADVEAIRLLSNFAIQLSQGGIIIPGNVTFNGKVGISGKNPSDMPTNLGDGLRTFNIYSDGTIATGTNNVINAYLNKEGKTYSLNGYRIGEDTDNVGIFKGTRTSSSSSSSSGATTDLYNLSINSNNGIGFKDTNKNKTNIWFDVITGTINCKALNITG